MPRGQILPGNAFLIHTAMGEAGHGDDPARYQLSTGVSGSPMVRDKVTRKWFHLCWRDIIEMAIEAGVGVEDDDGVRSDGSSLGQ